MRDPLHVEKLGRPGGVVGLEVILEHLAAGVGMNEQDVPTLEGRRQQKALRASVRDANAQRAGVLEGGKNLVVRVAEDVVVRSDDRVGPGAGRTGAGALVLDGPGHGDLGGVADRQRRRVHENDREVRIRRQRHRDGGGVVVVAFVGQLVDISCRIRHDHQVQAPRGVDR